MSYVLVYKRNKRNYDKLSPKQVETQPWDTLYIDLIGKYRNKGGRKYAIKGKKGKDVFLQAIILTVLASDWIEIRSVLEARADLVANQVELVLLTRFPSSNKVILYKFKICLTAIQSMMTNDEGISFNSISTRYT